MRIASDHVTPSPSKIYLTSSSPPPPPSPFFLSILLLVLFPMRYFSGVLDGIGDPMTTLTCSFTMGLIKRYLRVYPLKNMINIGLIGIKINFIGLLCFSLCLRSYVDCVCAIRC